jgi:hypothetical protein
MPKNKRLPDELLAKLHGKGTMSEILDIERARLLKQSEQDMRRQLGGLESPGLGGQKTPDSGVAPALALQPKLQPTVLAEVLVSPGAEREPSIPPSMSAQVQNVAAEHHTSVPMPMSVATPITKKVEVEVETYQPATGDSYNPSRPLWPIAPARSTEGLSVLSRVVGDDLSELGTIFRHSVETVAAPPRFLPEVAQTYYAERVDPVLPFTAQRNLLAAIRRLTLGWGALSCQITLELLSNVSGIRNFKTLRKWLADLNRRNLIRYTPVHGDLRGSVVTLTPPAEVSAEIERCWHEGTLHGNRSASHNEAN